MWCVLCNSAFSYATGQPERIQNTFHNPHFHEYRARLNSGANVTRGRELNDIPCGGMPRVRELRVRFGPGTMGQRVLVWHGLCQHIDDTVVPKYMTAPEQQETKRRMWRIDYMSGKITLEQCTRLLAGNDLKTQRCVEVRDVLVMLRDTWTDAFRSSIVVPSTPESAFQTLEATVQRTVAFAQEAFGVIARVWKCRVPRIGFNEEGVLTFRDVGTIGPRAM
tara:strand:+ start:115 stop:777 length:663 start_codon:yes stop_codon:yes gene_type:complete